MELLRLFFNWPGPERHNQISKAGEGEEEWGGRQGSGGNRKEGEESEKNTKRERHTRGRRAWKRVSSNEQEGTNA